MCIASTRFYKQHRRRRSMSKRSLNILTGVIILGLIVSVIIYNLSAGFQNWVHVWIADPAGLAATATVVAAVATLLAVIVGLRGIYVGRALAREAFDQAEKAQRQARRQFLEAQYSANRPLLVPAAADLSEIRELEEPMTFVWDSSNVFVTLQNVGNGTATNIWIAVLPPLPAPDAASQYLCRLGTPLPAGSDPVKVYLRQSAPVFSEDQSIKGHALHIPPERAAGPADTANHFLARLSITYQDIFGRKHASIFDLSDWGIWVNVAFLPNIEHGLAELQAAPVAAR
jgi:hypothetical protein